MNEGLIKRLQDLADGCFPNGEVKPVLLEAISALTAQQSQEPVAWRFNIGGQWFTGSTYEGCKEVVDKAGLVADIQPLYTAPASGVREGMLRADCGDAGHPDHCGNAQCLPSARKQPVPVEHVDGKWCADLHCNKCYSADTWQKSALQRAKNSDEHNFNRWQKAEALAEQFRKDAERYRWLREQHEGKLPIEMDADGFPMPQEVAALAFTVFYPDPTGDESLVVVPTGNLDETIDAAIDSARTE